jgi:hypothetical protein
VGYSKLVPSLGHPHLPCFPCFYVASGSHPLRPFAPFLALLKLLRCCTLPPIDAHRVPLHNPGHCPPHDASNDAEVDQLVHDVVWHIAHHIKAMRMCLMRAAGNNAEHDGIDDQSSVNIAQVLVIPQLGG